MFVMILYLWKCLKYFLEVTKQPLVVEFKCGSEIIVPVMHQSIEITMVANGNRQSEREQMLVKEQ